MNDVTPPTLPLELDGPPRAYFELSHDTSIHGGVVRITRLVYRSIRVIGPTEDAVRAWMDSALAEIRAWCAAEENHAIIFWRRRPRFEESDGVEERWPTEEGIDAGAANVPATIIVPKHWQGSCRLITSMPMPEEIWSKYEVKEGEPAKCIPAP
jgi:hypothetical protein